MKLITAQEVAKIMNCAESTIRTNAKKGTLGFEAVKVGSLWKFRDEEVYEYVYGKDWKNIVSDVVCEEPKPEVSDAVVTTMSIDEVLADKVVDGTPVTEPESKPVPMSARPVNVVPLGAQEVKFEE